MRPIFTVHAGEFLVGEYIEQTFKDKNVWVPTKDRGLDLLITNETNSKSLSVQVKFSRDFLPTMKLEAHARKELRSCTWFSLDRDKIARSVAEVWVFVLLGFETKSRDFLAISPQEILRRLEKIDPQKARYQVYIWVTNQDRAWLTRGVTKDEQLRISEGTFHDELRDVSAALNNWERVEAL
jgi:hypothetical protein